jgi:hypothetical protein
MSFVLLVVAVLATITLAFAYAARIPIFSFLIAGSLLAFGYYAWIFTNAALHQSGWWPFVVLWSFPIAIGACVLGVLLAIRTFGSRPSLLALLMMLPIVGVLNYIDRQEKAEARREQMRKNEELAREQRWANEHRALSPTEAKQEGIHWAEIHSIDDATQCNGAHASDISSRTDFIAGCMEGVAQRKQSAGMKWAKEHAYEFKDCTPIDAAFADSDFIHGCLDQIHERHQNAGRNFALSNFVFDKDTCTRALEAREDPDFVNGCENAFAGPSLREGAVRWVDEKEISRPEDCHGRIKGAPEAFEAVCEEIIRKRRKDAGGKWADTHLGGDIGACVHSGQAFGDTDEFVSACTSTWHTRRAHRGRDWAESNHVFLVVDCDSEFGGSADNADALRGCKKRASSPQAAREAGERWALEHHFFEESACENAVSNAPDAFIRECKETVTAHIRATLHR